MSGPVELLTSTYVRLLREVNESLNTHYHGFAQVSRNFRHSLGPRFARRLNNLDTAYHIMRHLDAVVWEDLRHSVVVALQAHFSLDSGDLRKEFAVGPSTISSSTACYSLLPLYGVDFQGNTSDSEASVIVDFLSSLDGHKHTTAVVTESTMGTFCKDEARGGFGPTKSDRGFGGIDVLEGVGGLGHGAELLDPVRGAEGVEGLGLRCVECAPGAFHDFDAGLGRTWCGREVVAQGLDQECGLRLAIAGGFGHEPELPGCARGVRAELARAEVAEGSIGRAGLTTLLEGRARYGVDARSLQQGSIGSMGFVWRSREGTAANQIIWIARAFTHQAPIKTLMEGAT